MPTYSQRTGASANDGYKDPNFSPSWDYTATVILTGAASFPTRSLTAAVRFTGVGIVPGSTIDSAFLKFTAQFTDTNNGKTKVYGIDEDSTADLSTDPTGRSKTTAAIDWDINGVTNNTVYTSPDIKTIIQEIIDRAGWASGNAIGFLVEDDGSVSDHFFHSYDGDPNKAPLLEINYTIPNTSTSSSTTSSSTSTSTSTSSSTSSSSTSSSSTTTDPYDVTGKYVIRVSKPGKDALAETSPNEFYMDSRYPLLKVHSFGTFSFNAALESTEITHNLGYKPFALVFSKLVDYDYVGEASVFTDEYYQHDWFVEGATKEWWGYTEIYDNKIKVIVGQTDVISGGPITGFYYIFKDEA